MDPTLKQVLITAGGTIFAATVGALVSWLWLQKAQKTKVDEQIDKRVSELEKQLGIVGAQVAPFNTAFQSILIKQLTHAHTPYQDALLKKLGDTGTPPITPKEEAELLDVLKEIAADPNVPDDERDAAEILPIQMRRVKREAAALTRGEGKLVDIQVVGRVKSDKEE